MIISMAIAFTSTAKAEEKHYMTYDGEHSQGHMMEGKEHPDGISTDYVEKYGNGKLDTPKDKHYMTYDGEHSQAHIMEGKSHPKGVSTDYVEKYGDGKFKEMSNESQNETRFIVEGD